MHKILYIDMDDVLVDFQSGIDTLSIYDKEMYKGRYDEVPGIFSKMQPISGSIRVAKRLANEYDVYILSTAPWNNPSAWSDKLLWIKQYLPEVGYKRLIITHHKNLNIGDYLIDDRDNNGADKFKGELIKFGSKEYPNWETIENYLLISK